MRALLIGSRLTRTVMNSVDQLPTSIQIVGDSQTIIGAMDAEDRVLDLWFGNRTDEVHEAMREWKDKGVLVHDLHHWPTSSNIADLATRGVAKPEDISPDSTYQRGPEILQYPRAMWPISRDFCRLQAQTLKDHANRCLHLAQTRKEQPDTMQTKLEAIGAKRISEYLALIRYLIPRKFHFQLLVGAVARWHTMLKAAKNEATTGDNQTKNAEDSREEPTVSQRKTAEHAIFMAATAVTDPKDFYRFNPVLSHGVLVTRGGRLASSAMTELFGTPELPLLSYDNPLSKLIMLEAHEDGHFRVDSTLEKSRRKAWIANGRKLAKLVCNQCLFCRMEDKVKVEQAMGMKPEGSVVPNSRIFSRVHTDLFGPYTVRAMNNARSRLKVWVLLITCEATGAFHTEVIDGYGTLKFLTQWEKFVDNRGRPSHVISDCGSNFRSKKNYVANREDPNDFTTWDWGTVEARETRKLTTWEFVPVGAQWRNGKAERRVKIMKKILHNVLTTSLMGKNPDHNYTEFQGLMSRIASIANDRPVDLKLLNEDVLIPLTVNMLILGRGRDIPAPDIVLEDEEVEFALQHKFTNELERLWWKQWRAQALPALIPHHSGRQANRHRNLEVGDVVAWLQETKISASYRLARIVKATPSPNDGLVRDVTIAFLPKNVLSRKQKVPKYNPQQLETKDLAVQSLVLLVTAQEVEERFWNKPEETTPEPAVDATILPQQKTPCQVDD